MLRIRSFSLLFRIALAICVAFLVSSCQSGVRYASGTVPDHLIEQWTGTDELAESTPQERFVAGIAEQWLGTPYHYAGNDRSGIDCSGLMVQVFSKAGVSLPRTSSQQFSTGADVNSDDLRIGDLVFFNLSGAGISHVGVYIGNNHFIHASSSRGVVRDNLSDRYFFHRLAGARRVL